MKNDTSIGLSSLEKPKGTSTIYKGERFPEDVINVTVDGQRLTPRASLARRNHSPDGFEWGYGGSGPAQLALAILLNYYGASNSDKWEHYQEFKWAVVAHFPFERWELTGAEIEAAMGKITCSHQESI